MSFNPEDKIRWEELAPSLQNMFKEFRNTIDTRLKELEDYIWTKPKEIPDPKDTANTAIGEVTNKGDYLEYLEKRIRIIEESGGKVPELDWSKIYTVYGTKHTSGNAFYYTIDFTLPQDSYIRVVFPTNIAPDSAFTVPSYYYDQYFYINDFNIGASKITIPPYLKKGDRIRGKTQYVWLSEIKGRDEGYTTNWINYLTYKDATKFYIAIVPIK